MSQSRILIVDSKPRRANAIRDAVTGVLPGQPIYREDGESAIFWVNANECGLCILSYELSGINGLETLARMRTRRPDLPAIIISESKEQHVAVAAFRAGVFDFVPATGAFATVVAESARRALGATGSVPRASAAAAMDPTLSHIPRERLEPSYQNRLRSIGRQLDVYQFSTVTILEVEGGFLVRGQRQRARQPQILELPDSDFPRLVAGAIHEDISGKEKPISASELIPTGYEDFLRALGYRLDQISAESLVVTELEKSFVVSGRGNDEASSLPGLMQFEYILAQPDIELMLNEAFGRRGKMEARMQHGARSSGSLRGLLRRLN